MKLISQREKARYKKRFDEKVKELTGKFIDEVEGKSEQESELLVKTYNRQWVQIASKANASQIDVKIPTDLFTRYLKQLMESTKPKQQGEII